MDDSERRTTSIYSVNGKFRSQLVALKEGGWICQIWTVTNGGKDHLMLKNVKPFATKEEAIQMAQESFAQLTGDDRYFLGEDVFGKSKPE